MIEDMRIASCKAVLIESKKYGSNDKLSEKTVDDISPPQIRSTASDNTLCFSGNPSVNGSVNYIMAASSAIGGGISDRSISPSARGSSLHPAELLRVHAFLQVCCSLGESRMFQLWEGYESMQSYVVCKIAYYLCL